MIQQRKLFPFLLALLTLTSLSFTACKKDKPGEEGDKVLIINTGARSINPDESLAYTASFVNDEGTVTAAGVSWSTSDGNIASISASGVVNPAAVGSVTVTASITEDGINYTASVPLGIIVPGVFAVVPSAIIYETGGSLQLETVFFGTASPSYTFSSSDNNVATVSSSGQVNFTGQGSCTLTVTASTHPNSPFLVPVLVIGPPAVALPVTRIEVSPASADLFRGQTVQLTAQAFDLDGSTSASFSWSSADASVASVDANGLVTGNNIGEAVIFATANGITGQAEVYVSPDTVVVVTPYLGSIPAGGSKQYTAEAYNIRNGATLLPGITNFDWDIPTYGFSVFDFATVSSTGMVSVNSSALVGNLTFVTATVPGNPELTGVGGVMVSICDCGNGNASVNNINIAGGSINMSLLSSPTGQVTATASDANGNPVASPALKYCADDFAVVTVDEDTGELFAVGPGTATVTVCSGGYAEATVSVTVTF